MAIKLSTTCRNNMLDGITTSVGGSGKLRIYTGSAPAGPGSAATGTLLAELTCNATFAAAASSGVLTLNSITDDSSADATGTAGWFRIWKSDGTTAVIDGSVTATGGGGDLQLNSTSIASGITVSVTSATFTAGNA